MRKHKDALAILVVAYSLFVGNGVNPTVAAVVVMAGLFGTLSLKILYKAWRVQFPSIFYFSGISAWLKIVTKPDPLL